MFNHSTEKINILYVCFNLNTGGVQNFLINNFIALDKKIFNISFCVLNKKKNYYDDFIEKNGGKLYKITSFLDDKKAFTVEFNKLLKTINVDVVHTHLNFLSIPVLKICKKNHVAVRVCHGHASYKSSNLFSFLYRIYFKLIISNYANGFCACSSESSDWLFGKRKKGVFIMDGSVDFNLYKFNNDTRQKKRMELNAVNKRIFINVAALVPIKNQVLILRAFSMIPNDNSLLIICGSGECEKDLREEILKLRLEDRVFLLGNRKDISELLSASDLFVLSSLAEGLSLSSLEAQANGLPCLLSNGVPKNIDISNNCYFFDPTDVDELSSLMNKQFNRKEISFETRYNIAHSIKNVQKYYVDMVNRFTKKDKE